MKRTFEQLLIIGVSGTLLTGCCTGRSAKQWEYKIGSASNEKYHAHNLSEIEEMYLNDMAKDGWIFIEKDEHGDFFFKRLKQ